MPQKNWPAILQLTQHDELLYFPNNNDWEEYISQNQHTLCLQDTLIDSLGYIYQLKTPLNTTVSKNYTSQLPQWIKQDKQMDVPTMLPLVRKYGQYQGHCCSAKIVFNTIQQGIATVAELEQLY